MESEVVCAVTVPENLLTMNWLAHLYLSAPHPAVRIGNLLPDLLPASVLQSLTPEMKRGAQQHLRIDSFTDAHPTVRQSINRIPAPFRRYGGILVDVFYDHFLSIRWNLFSSVPLPVFVTEIYSSFDQYRNDIPDVAIPKLEAMREENWLESYGTIRGIRTTLDRISQRLKRPFPLAHGVRFLEENYAELEADFGQFFPELQAREATKC